MQNHLITALRLTVSGRVQGVGFRPFPLCQDSCRQTGHDNCRRTVLLNVVRKQNYQGQAAMLLEALGIDADEAVALPLCRNREGLWLADWAPLIGLLQDASLSTEQCAGQFHVSLAESLQNQAQQIRNEYGVNKVGIAGGVFQNKRLSEAVSRLLKAQDFEVFILQRVPLNDAGLSFGQIIKAAAQGKDRFRLSHRISGQGA